MEQQNYTNTKDLTDKDKKSIIASVVRSKFINDKKYLIDVTMLRIGRIFELPVRNVKESIRLSIVCRSIKSKRRYPKYHYLFCHTSDID